MNKKDQRRIVSHIISGLRDAANERIARVPENWDGIELRNWIVHLAADQFAFEMPARRRREFNIDIVSNNL